jgi:type I restriction enzyme S subunit
VQRKDSHDRGICPARCQQTHRRCLEHIPRRSISQTDWVHAEDVTSSKHKFVAEDILPGKIRPYFHKVSLAFVDGVASSDAIVSRPQENDLHSLVLMTVSSDPFVAMAAQTMKKGSKMPHSNQPAKKFCW